MSRPEQLAFAYLELTQHGATIVPHWDSQSGNATPHTHEIRYPSDSLFSEYPKRFNERYEFMMRELGDVDEYALQGARGTLFFKNQAAINDHIGNEKVDATNIDQVKVGLVGEPFIVKQGENNMMAHSFRLLPPHILDPGLTEEACKTLCAEVKAADN